MLNNDLKKEEEPIHTDRSIFARNTFRGFLDKLGVGSLEEVQAQTFPEMMKLRESAISHRERNEKSKIETAYRQKQISPRTYDIKRKDLEVWVTKEREEVKKTKKHVEDGAQKTARIMSESAQNSEQIKRILKGGDSQHHHISCHSNAVGSQAEAAQSARIDSKRDGIKPLIALIYDSEKDQPNVAFAKQQFVLQDFTKRNKDESSSSQGSKKQENRSKSPHVLLSDYVDQNSPAQESSDLFSNLIVINPSQLKNFSQTAQKPNLKDQLTSSKKSQQTSDNPEDQRVSSETIKTP